MEWMNDYTPLIYMDMITYPGPDAGAGLVILCQQKGLLMSDVVINLSCFTYLWV